MMAGMGEWAWMLAFAQFVWSIAGVALQDFSRLVPEQSFHCKEGLVAIKNSTLHNPIPDDYVGPWQWRRKEVHPCFKTGLEVSRARRT